MSARTRYSKLRNFTQFSWVFCLILLISCTDKESKITCGCDGTLKQNLLDEEGIMVKVYDGVFDGFRFLSLRYGYFDFCVDVPVELQIDGLMLKIAGVINTPCMVSKDPLLDVQHYPFRLSNYTIPADSLFKKDPVTIKIFTSITSLSSGYGYSIKTQSGFKIIQDQIPAVGGLKTFSTATKAFKVAVLVGHKITLNKGLPTIDLKDLYYLQALGN